VILKFLIVMEFSETKGGHFHDVPGIEQSQAETDWQYHNLNGRLSSYTHRSVNLNTFNSYNVEKA
jgi:hypothetical protein